MSTYKPFELLDKCINQKIYLVTINDKQISGILKGFNEYYNMVLENVEEKYTQNNESVIKKYKSMLMNGHDIAYVVPGVDQVSSWKS